MDYTAIEAVNKSIKTTSIKGKNYAEVPQRITAFRKLYPEGSIITDLLQVENGVCIFKASVLDDTGKVLATGTAYEKEDSTFINKTSYIENCETSAVGRALGMLGIGIDVSVASAEEVANAINNQPKPKKTEAVKEVDAKARVIAFVMKSNMSEENIEKLCASYKVSKLQELTAQQCEHYIKAARKKGKEI